MPLWVAARTRTRWPALLRRPVLVWLLASAMVVMGGPDTFSAPPAHNNHKHGSVASEAHRACYRAENPRAGRPGVERSAEPASLVESIPQ